MESVRIGTCREGIVEIDLAKSRNPHISIFGGTGGGKSVAGQTILRNLSSQESTSVVYDFHHLFHPDNILPALWEDMRRRSKEVDVSSNGISLPLFTPLQRLNGTTENTLDILTSLVDVLASVLCLGNRQKSCLRQALEVVLEEHGYAELGIAALDKALNAAVDDRAVSVQDKIYYLLKKNLFRDGECFLQENSINILRLSNLPETVQLQVMELVLAYLWRLANTGVFIERPLCIYLDECQNLNWGKTGTISTIFAEGRKLGLQLIGITQFLGGNSQTNMARNLLQSATQIFFAPAENETAMIAGIIEPKRHLYWQMKLNSLRVGECIAKGSFLINGRPYFGPIKIKI